MSLKSDLPLRPVRRPVRQSSIAFALQTARVPATSENGTQASTTSTETAGVIGN